jgi:hypothetical protein
MISRLISLILEFDRISNADSDTDLKIKAMKYILREVCNKYKEKRDPTFNSDEISKRLRGLGPGYVDLNIKETWAQSRFVNIDENYNFTLNEEGKKACKRGELD